MTHGREIQIRDPQPENAMPLFGINDQDEKGCASHANLPKFGDPDMPQHCMDDRRPLTRNVPDWRAFKRQSGDSISDDIGDADGDIGDRTQGNDGNDRNDDDGNDRTDGNYRDGNRHDGSGNSAGCKTISILSVASLAALSAFIVM